MFVGTAREFRFIITFPASALMSIIFIRIIQTIVICIADVNARNAIAIVAGKQVTETRFSARFAVIRRLVGSVTAIVVSIAIPRSRNAAVVVGATETVGGTRPLRTRRFVLIGIVTAIVISIAQPERFHANVGRVAFEMLQWASGISSASFARLVRRVGIFTIVDSIAHLIKNDKSFTAKMLSTFLIFYCKKNQTMGKGSQP